MWIMPLYLSSVLSTNAQTTLLTEDFENWPLTTQGWSFKFRPCGWRLNNSCRFLELRSNCTYKEVIPLTMIGGLEHQVPSCVRLDGVTSHRLDKCNKTRMCLSGSTPWAANYAFYRGCFSFNCRPFYGCCKLDVSLARF